MQTLWSNICGNFAIEKFRRKAMTSQFNRSKENLKGVITSKTPEEGERFVQEHVNWIVNNLTSSSVVPVKLFEYLSVVKILPEEEKQS